MNNWKEDKIDAIYNIFEAYGNVRNANLTDETDIKKHIGIICEQLEQDAYKRGLEDKEKVKQEGIKEGLERAFSSLPEDEIGECQCDGLGLGVDGYCNCPASFNDALRIAKSNIQQELNQLNK